MSRRHSDLYLFTDGFGDALGHANYGGLAAWTKLFRHSENTA
jgi:hypothetical protein